MQPRERLPVYTLYRPRPGGQWVVIAHGPMDALLEMSREGDEVHPAGSAPLGYRGQ